MSEPQIPAALTLINSSSSFASFIPVLKSFLNSNGPAFLEVIIKTGSPKNLLRIKNLSAIKKNFIKK